MAAITSINIDDSAQMIINAEREQRRMSLPLEVLTGDLGLRILSKTGEAPHIARAYQEDIAVAHFVQQLENDPSRNMISAIHSKAQEWEKSGVCRHALEKISLAHKKLLAKMNPSDFEKRINALNDPQEIEKEAAKHIDIYDKLVERSVAIQRQLVTIIPRVSKRVKLVHDGFLLQREAVHERAHNLGFLIQFQEGIGPEFIDIEALRKAAYLYPHSDAANLLSDLEIVNNKLTASNQALQNVDNTYKKASKEFEDVAIALRDMQQKFNIRISQTNATDAQFITNQIARDRAATKVYLFGVREAIQLDNYNFSYLWVIQEILSNIHFFNPSDSFGNINLKSRFETPVAVYDAIRAIINRELTQCPYDKLKHKLRLLLESLPSDEQLSQNLHADMLRVEDRILDLIADLNETRLLFAVQAKRIYNKALIAIANRELATALHNTQFLSEIGIHALHTLDDCSWQVIVRHNRTINLAVLPYDLRDQWATAAFG